METQCGSGDPGNRCYEDKDVTKSLEKKEKNDKRKIKTKLGEK